MGKLALIVEDEAPMRTIYEFVLRKQFGFTVLHAHDGSEALDILQAHSPDIVFLDMLLPRVNGMQVLTYIYNAPHLTQARVVIVSAHKNVLYTDALRSSDLFLLKPVRVQDIQRVVNDLPRSL